MRLHTSDAVEVLCSFGEERENSPLLKGTQAHQQALLRVALIQQKE